MVVFGAVKLQNINISLVSSLLPQNHIQSGWTSYTIILDRSVENTLHKEKWRRMKLKVSVGQKSERQIYWQQLEPARLYCDLLKVEQG